MDEKTNVVNTAVDNTVNVTANETVKDETSLVESLCLKMDKLTKQLIFVIVLLSILVVLCIGVIAKLSSSKGATPVTIVNTSHRALAVSIDKDYDEDEASDFLQVQAGLSNGGFIKINPSTSGLNAAFGPVYSEYSAFDSDGYYYPTGTIINYIASQGWILSAAQTNGTLYFVK